jgi:excisionase family DNA binding protein
MRISTAALRRLIRSGHIPHIRPIPRRVLVDAAAVERHLRQSMVAGDANVAPPGRIVLR